MGAIKNGITTFLYPKDNNKEFTDFYEESKNSLSENIVFKEIDKINDVLDFVFT